MPPEEVQVAAEDVSLLASASTLSTVPTAVPSRASAALTIFACTISGGLLALPCIFSIAAPNSSIF